MDKVTILVTLILTIKYLLENRSAHRIKRPLPIDQTTDYLNRNNHLIVLV